jgi:hypothetical protein
MFIALGEAVADHANLRDELTDGSRKAIGLANGNGLPTSIPCEHFAIAWEQPRLVAVNRPPISERTIDELMVNVNRPPISERTIDELMVNAPMWQYAEPWLDVAKGIIYAADGTAQWTQLRVEAEPTERIPLPDLKVANTLPSKAAAWGLQHLYGKTGYPNLSMPALAGLVNKALRTDYAPILFRRKVSPDTVGRLLKPRR